MTAAECSLRLAVEATSITRGRHFARDTVVAWGLEELADDVQLGISELVTNAIQHARTEVRLTIRRDTAVTVFVEDRLPELHRPSAPRVDAVAEHGRGLQIVAAISADWGVSVSGAGKCVWFALRLPDVHGTDADIYAIDRKQPRTSAGPGQPGRDERNAVVGGR